MFIWLALAIAKDKISTIGLAVQLSAAPLTLLVYIYGKICAFLQVRGITRHLFNFTWAQNLIDQQLQIYSGLEQIVFLGNSCKPLLAMWIHYHIQKQVQKLKSSFPEQQKNLRFYQAGFTPSRLHQPGSEFISQKVASYALAQVVRVFYVEKRLLHLPVLHNHSLIPFL